MKVGLVRHFKVKADKPTKDINWKEYKEIMERYDSQDVIPMEVDLKGINWNKCYASTLPRAIITAEAIYDGEIETSEKIKEVDMRVIDEVKGSTDIKDWTIYSFLGWAKGQDNIGEGVEETRKRVNEFLDILEEESDESDNILVVCHGMIMTIIEEQLILRGFFGEENIIFAKNGDVYVYEK